MYLTKKDLERKISDLERSRGHASKLREIVDNLDITDQIADVYLDLHKDIETGTHEFFNLPGGRGSGKSSFCALEIVLQIMRDTTRTSNALVVRKWAVTLRGSVFSQIQWAIDILGVSEHWKSTLTPLQFTYETGQTIRLTGLDDPQKLKSLKPSRGYYKFLWIEEFSEITGEPELRNLQQSVLRGGDKFVVFRSFNPPISSANWANQYIERPDDRAVTLRTNYQQVPKEWLGDLFLDEAERLREINPKAYEHEYLGVPVGNGSEVFPNLEIRKITDEEVQNAQYLYCGLDFGFSSDPSAFVRVSYDRKTDTILFLDEIVKRHLSNRELATMIKEKGFHLTGRIEYVELYGGITAEQQRIYCDCADPRSIADLRTEGLKTLPCHKEPGCVQYRVKWLQHRKIVIDPERTPESAREFQNYCYVVDRKSGEITSELPDADNHTIDAVAYALDSLIYNRKNPV